MSGMCTYVRIRVHAFTSHIPPHTTNTLPSHQALGIALRLTFDGANQLVYAETWCAAVVVGVCASIQINYLNKALDLFNTAIVSPIYYVMFTTLTIIASVIMFQEEQTVTQMATEMCGFVTIISGVFLLHATKDMDVSLSSLYQSTPANAREQDARTLFAPARSSGKGWVVVLDGGGRVGRMRWVACKNVHVCVF